ncbi:MAG: hypothetical protein WCO56_24775 [Verrucomicrobiota bacterium]
MANLPSGLPEIVANEEDLARFLTQSNQFTASMAKPSAFLPSPRDHETSVSRHGNEPLENLWAMGNAAAGERNLYGAAIFKANTARLAQLDVIADEPPPLHAVIRGWPWDESDPELQKAKQKEKAALIASEAVLLLRR